MHDRSLKQKEIEEKCILDVVENLRKKQKLTGVEKAVLSILTCAMVNRTLNEHPDFVFLKQSEECDTEHSLWGVEHFRVHQQSVGDQFTNSIGFSESKRTKALFDKWVDVVHGNKKTRDMHREQINHDIGKEILTRFDLNQRCPCASFWGSLASGTKTHYKKIENYYKNLQDLNIDHCNFGLIFVAETFSNLRNMYVEYDGFCGIKNNFQMPITEEVVDVIEGLNHKKVQYFVLCAYNSEELSSIRKPIVYVLPTKNIRNYLKQIHVPVFHYVDFDSFAPEIYKKMIKSEKLLMDITGELSIRYQLTHEFDNEKIMCVLEMACLLRKYSKQNLPILTSMCLGRWYYVFRDVEWEKTSPHVPILKSQRDKELVRKRMMEYESFIYLATHKSR